MSSPLDDEIRGDWSNLKGTEYHFIYTLWLLLCKKCSSVAFFKGNDLLAHPIVPPISQQIQTISSHAQRSHDISRQEDLWIQLKATSRKWTLFQLQKENLLANFLYNALLSEKNGNNWSVYLVTPAEIDSKEILNFVQVPSNFRNSEKNLEQMINEVQQRWASEFQIVIGIPQLKSLVSKILEQIAQNKSIPIEVLKAQIETQIAYQRPDPESVRAIAERLLGALLVDSSKGPQYASTYTTDWLEQITGLPLVLGALLTTNPVQASSELLKKSLPFAWDEQMFVARATITKALDQFISSSHSLFILVGSSGTGKSWAAIHWLLNGLQNHNRFLFKDSDLYAYKSAGMRELSTLVAGKLRSYASPDENDETLLKRFLPSIQTDGSKRHLVLVIDDLHFPEKADERLVFLHYLGNLVKQCDEKHIKIVFICEKQIWASYQLQFWRNIEKPNLFLAKSSWANSLQNVEPYLDSNQRIIIDKEEALKADPNPYSFLVSDFDNEEIKQVLTHWMPQNIVDKIVYQFTSPAFSLLFNPYILNLYLQQNKELLVQVDHIPSIDIDNLIARKVTNKLSEMAEKMGHHNNQLVEAFNTLIQSLWVHRPHGLSSLEVLKCLKDYFLEDANRVLRELQDGGLLNIGYPPHLADSIVSDHLFAQILLQQVVDGKQIIESLTPNLDSTVVAALLRRVHNPTAFAEKLLHQNQDWLNVVTEGLAQRPSYDFKILAFLTTLTQPNALGINISACDALGILAARGGDAWPWVVDMYLSNKKMERWRGGRILAKTIHYAPDLVKTVIEKQLVIISETREEDLLSDVFDPLHLVEHSRAAEIGQQLLDQYGHLILQCKGSHRDRVLRDLDSLRGKFASILGETKMRDILIELQSQDAMIRSRSAHAIRAFAFQHPKIVEDVLCKAISNEQDECVLNQLLWSIYPIAETALGKLLNAIGASRIVQWNKDSCTIGMALAVLADATHHDPSRVQSLLPEHLTTHSLTLQALHYEMYVYAWWCCAQYNAVAYDKLKLLTQTEIAESTPKEFHIFILRGTAVAILGLICIDLGISCVELSGKQTAYPLDNLEFFYLDLVTFVESHLTLLKNHSLLKSCSDLLELCINKYNEITLHPANDLRKIRHICMLSCDKLFVSLSNNQSNRKQEDVSVDYSGIDLFKQEGVFLKLLQAPLSNILSILEKSISKGSDLAMLYHWKEEAHSWPVLLISNVYCRMFDISAIDAHEALKLCTQMITALEALPYSIEQEQHRRTYQAIQQSLVGNTQVFLDIFSFSNIIQGSHACSLDIIRDSCNPQKNLHWLFGLLHEKKQWIKASYYLNDSSISLGTHREMIYVLPAVRLAGVASRQFLGCEDPIALFLEHRKQAGDLIEKHWNACDGSAPVTSKSLNHAINAFEKLRETLHPYDDRFWQYRGLIFLRLDRLEDSAQSLEHCLSLPWTSDHTRSDAYYNLGCICARKGQEENCQHWLEKWSQLRPNDPYSLDWLQQDPDLEKVRTKEWFRSLYRIENNEFKKNT